MHDSLINPDNLWVLWTVIILSAWVGVWAEQKTKIGAKVSGCLVTMGLTFLLSNLALTDLPGAQYLYLLFELSTDALNFEYQAQGFGIRRYQALGWVCLGMFPIIWATVGLRKHLTPKGIYLVPLSFFMLSE